MAMSGSPLPEREGDSYFRIRFMVRSMCSPGSGSPSRSLLWIEPESYRAPLPSVPVMELVRGWNLACDVHDHGLALPALDQLLLAEISPQELFDKLHAAVFEKLRVGFQATVERHRDFPWARKDFRILDRHLVMYGVTRNRREAFNQMQGVAVKVAGPVEPVLAVETGHVDDQCIAFPAADRMTHVGIVGWALDLIEVDRASGAGKGEGHLNLVRSLHNLEGVGHVHGAWNARQIALQLRVPVNPVLRVLFFDRRRFGCVRDLTIALHHTDRSRNAAGCAQCEHWCRRDLDVIIRVHAPLRDRCRTRFVRLQIPMGFVKSLPDSAEIGFAVYCASGRGCRSLAGPCQSHGDNGGHNRSSNCHHNQRGDETVLHDRSPFLPSPGAFIQINWSGDYFPPRYRQILRQILRIPRCTVWPDPDLGPPRRHAPRRAFPQATPSCQSSPRGPRAPCRRDLPDRSVCSIPT